MVVEIGHQAGARKECAGDIPAIRRKVIADSRRIAS